MHVCSEGGHTADTRRVCALQLMIPKVAGMVCLIAGKLSCCSDLTEHASIAEVHHAASLATETVGIHLRIAVKAALSGSDAAQCNHEEAQAFAISCCTLFGSMFTAGKT